MKLAVLSYLATYGNAPLLAKGLEALGCDVRLVLRYRNAAGRDDFGFADEFPCLQFEDPRDRLQARTWAQEADRLIVMAIPSLGWLAPRLLAASEIRSKGGAVILSSSHLLYGLPTQRRQIEASGLCPVDFNKRQIRESGLAVFVQPHKRPYVADLDPLPYYPPIEPRRAISKPRRPITIGHTPGRRGRWHWKGTVTVDAVFRSMMAAHGDDEVGCVILGETPHAKVLEMRDGWHIFVDQVCGRHEVAGDHPDYYGGLDKSGLEAMAAGCAVITSGGPLADARTPLPPVMLADAGTLEERIEHLLANPNGIAAIAAAGRKWIGEVCAPERAARRVLEAIV